MTIARLRGTAIDIWGIHETTTGAQVRNMVKAVCETGTSNAKSGAGHMAATCGAVYMIGASSIDDKSSSQYQQLKKTSDNMLDTAESYIGEAKANQIAKDVITEIMDGLKRGDAKAHDNYKRMCTKN